MLYVHENNILSKIKSNYNHKGEQIKRFYENEYLPMRTKVLSLTFNDIKSPDFDTATNIFNDYYKKIEEFSLKNNISSQSKFASTFLEEISCYLFKDLYEIQNGTFGVYNKGIYAGLKIDSNRHIAVIKKDVDFCIGKKVNIKIDNQPSVELILPIVAVEVKTYLDATMFGEIKSSSKSIRSASPNSKAYVLMGYRCIADEHIIAARQDATLSEMFSLRDGENMPIKNTVIRDYWKEIKEAVDSITIESVIPSSGRLLNEPQSYYYQINEFKSNDLKVAEESVKYGK